MDDALRIVSINPAFEQLFGVTSIIVTGQSFPDLLLGEGASSGLRSALDTLIADGQPFNDTLVDYTASRRLVRHLMMNGRKLMREGGRQTLILLAIEDVTDQRRGQAATGTLAAIVGSSRDAIFSMDVAGNLSSWNAGAEAIFGFSEADMIGRSVSCLDDPTAIGPSPDWFAQFREGGETLHYKQSRLRKDASSVCVSVTDSPLRDNAGTLTGASSIARDITERCRDEHHRDILVGELNHRVKNTLAIVQAIASQTLRGDITLPDARDAFGARLMALARAHDLLIDENWAGTHLASVINATIAPHIGGQNRFVISGPFVALNPSVGMTFSMAIHELCMNAAKYGAFSVPEGLITIAWNVSQVHGMPVLHWTWTESGGPPVTKPVKTGFGTSLIEQALAMELSGKVSVPYHHDGVICVLDAPLPS